MTTSLQPAVLPEVLNELNANWADWFGSRPRPRSLSCVIQGTGVGKLIVFVLADGRRQPACIVKIPRSRRDNEGLAHEHELVVELRRRAGSALAAALPVPIAAPMIQGWQVTIEQVLPGQLWSGSVPSGNKFTLQTAEKHLNLFRQCYTSLQLATRPPVVALQADTVRELMLGPIEHAARGAELRPHEARYLVDLEEQAKALTGRPLPLGFVHGDLRAGNILAQGRQLVFIDWQFGQLRGLPMLDWFEFGFRYYCDAIGLAEITGDHDAYRAAFADVFLGGHPYADLYRQQTLACAGTLGIDSRYIDLLLSMWLVDNTNKYIAFLSERAEHGYLYLMQNPPGGPFRSYRQQLRRQVYPCLLGQLAHSTQAASLGQTTAAGNDDAWPAFG
jgi:hypothetical protein